MRIACRSVKAFPALVLAATAAFTLLAVAEIVLRFGLGLGHPVLIQADAAAGYTLKPNQNVCRFFCRTRTNRYGMRSDEVAEPKPAGALRLFFLGDSIAYGTGRVDQSGIFTEILHRDLPVIVHRPVEVLNASASGWAIDNELGYLRSRGAFGSDWVLLVLNSGDLTQPRSTLDQVPALPTKNPRLALGELWSRAIEPRFFHPLVAPDPGDRAQANAGPAIRANLADLDRFQALAASQHARMALIYIPFRRDIPSVSAAYGAMLRQWTGLHHVPMIDLTAAEAAHSSARITLDGGIHLNAEGNRIVACAIESAWPETIR